MSKKSGLLSLRRGGRNGDSAPSRGETAIVSDDWSRVATLMGPLKLSAEQMRSFPMMPGSDEEPWDVLLSLAAMDEHTALSHLSDSTGLEYRTEPRLNESASRFYQQVPASVARTHHVAGIESDGHWMTIATAQPMRPGLFNLIEDRVEMPLRIILSPRAAVANLINRGYEQQQDLVTEIVEEMPLDESALENVAGSIGQATDLLQLARQGPVIRLVNMILFEALRRRASDVHVHPLENSLSIRFRVDGMLIEAFSPPLSLAPAICSRLKVMTSLDIANRHSPQDGQTTVRIGNHKIDIRLSAIPTIYGERLVMRLLDQTQTELDLSSVGLSDAMQGQLDELIERPNGLILVTGPTGSGKTTTLYAALGKIDRSSRNVMTIEDPVEYHMPGISQMQVNPKRNVTFATGLRALLRQDPDVILVGEIRDEETAQLAIQASLTGHLVLATLHTNDAPSAIPRLIDIGAPPYLITSSLLAVMAQRLLRRVCTQCRGTGNDKGNGIERCETCMGTGYKGRVGVYEIMVMNDELRKLTAQSADSVTLYDAAKRGGFSPMTNDARDKLSQGITTESEISRVLR